MHVREVLHTKCTVHWQVSSIIGREGKYVATQTGREEKGEIEGEVGAFGRTWRHSGESNDIGLLD